MTHKGWNLEQNTTASYIHAPSFSSSLYSLFFSSLSTSPLLFPFLPFPLPSLIFSSLSPSPLFLLYSFFPPFILPFLPVHPSSSSTLPSISSHLPFASHCLRSPPFFSLLSFPGTGGVEMACCWFCCSSAMLTVSSMIIFSLVIHSSYHESYFVLALSPICSASIKLSLLVRFC